MAKNYFTEAEVISMAKDSYDDIACFQISASDSVLLVIDMQDEFVKPNWTPYWVPEATRQVPKIAKLIEFCRQKGIPVIYTAFADTYKNLDRPKQGNSMPNRYKNKVAEPDPAWFLEGNMWHELKPAENEIVILKPSYGAFYDTPLETILKNLKKDTVIVCGTLTNFCCSTTARQAYERGFKVVFGSDINSADDPLMHEVELKVLRKGFARVLSCKEIIEELK